MKFAWNGQEFSTFPRDQIDALAPECPVIYGLVTPQLEVYVGASRTPKSRLRAHLCSSSYSDWLKRLVLCAMPMPEGWGKMNADWQWTNKPEFQELCSAAQSQTRWCVFQAFGDDTFAEDIGIAEKAWIRALRASLNSPDAKGTYCNGPSRGLGVQEISAGVDALIPVLHTLEPWEPKQPTFNPLTVIQKPQPRTLGGAVVDLMDADVDVLNSVFEFAYYCLDNKQDQVPEVSRIAEDIFEAEALLAGIDKQIASAKRHQRRGFDAFWREVA